ncbi:MAG: DUF389 domain-containing protein [Ignavibacteria bacterium]|nr:DUF389 domain-containing protein [Ignavibacteria bacterium]
MPAITPRSLGKQFRHLVGYVFRIDETIDQEAVVASVKADIDFRGAKAWILIFAILVASLGLNTNSTAVVIGAMLISPLMGPIVGLGVSIGISDGPLLWKSLRNMLTAVVLSIGTSALYFLISPFDDAQSELLSRTTPTLLDAAIAIAGGLAGAVAVVRQDKSNVVPGVAIATALIPPLCTAGYGLAQWDLTFFIGAFYLFFINAVCIGAATYATTLVLKFKPVEQVDPEHAKRVRRTVLWVVGITLIPSVVIGWFILQENAFNRNVRYLVSAAEEQYPATSFVVSKSEWKRDTSSIVLTLVGPALSEAELTTVRGKALELGLQDSHLDIRQASGVSDLMMFTAGEKMRKDVLGDLYDKTLFEIRRKDSTIASLNNVLHSHDKQQIEVGNIFKEMQVIFPEVVAVNFTPKTVTYSTTGVADSISTAFVQYKKRVSNARQHELHKWLVLRLKVDTLVVKQIH